MKKLKNHSLSPPECPRCGGGQDSLRGKTFSQGPLTRSHEGPSHKPQPVKKRMRPHKERAEAAEVEKCQ